MKPHQKEELEQIMDKWTDSFLAERGGFIDGYNSTEILYWLASRDFISRSRVIEELEGMKPSKQFKTTKPMPIDNLISEAIEKIKNLK